MQLGSLKKKHLILSPEEQTETLQLSVKYISQSVLLLSWYFHMCQTMFMLQIKWINSKMAHKPKPMAHIIYHY